MSDFSNFTNIIKEFIEFFDELIAIEQEKLDAATKNQVSFVEECMHKEQAAILRLRGLEQKREKEQERLGMSGFTFRQILERASEEDANILNPLFNQLSGQVRMMQSLSDNAKDIIEVNLHMIQSSLARKTPGGEIYSASGTKKDNGNQKHFTSRSV